MSYDQIYRDILHVSHGPYADLTFTPSVGRLIRAWFYTIQYFFKLCKDRVLYGHKVILGPTLAKDRTWLLVGSKNNLDSLIFLRDRMPEAQYVAIHKAAQSLGPFPRISYHRALRYYGRFFSLFRKLYPVFGRILWWKLDAYAEAVGLYEAAIGILERGKPRALIFANDHGPHMRALLWAAKELHIPTIYLQHASVSSYFPPLRFDLNLLEGEDSLRKYEACGEIEGEVRLIGMPKFDRYLVRRNQSGQVRRIGICVSLLDEQDRITGLVKYLLDELPDTWFSFRPHPREARSFDLPEAVSISDARREDIFNFLHRQDLILAGDTSTHLEAVLLNVVSLYYPFHTRFADYYGYVRHGLVDRFDSPAAVAGYIRSIRDRKPDVYLRARYYNAVVGTPDEGRSAELAVEAIRATIG